MQSFDLSAAKLLPLDLGLCLFPRSTVRSDSGDERQSRSSCSAPFFLRQRVQRYREEAQRLEDKREQKLLDELSQRLPRQNPF